MKRWRIQYVDIGGRSGPTVHRSRESAEEELGGWLERLLYHIDESILIWETAGGEPRDRRGYVEDMRRTRKAMAGALEAGKVWKAHAAWRMFDEKWQRGLPWPEIGTVIVEETG